jgi:GNAT superfamily N-acetyltransferase
MGTLIRLATENDVQAAFRLMTDLGYPDVELERFTRAYHAVLVHPAMLLIVAEDENEEVIGLASISNRPQLRLTGNLVTIDEFVVAADARGKGVGRELLNAAIAMANKLGARRLELETNRARESYRREFYVKNGFIEADSAVMRIDYELPEGW